MRARLPACALLLAAALVGCRREDDFDQRYARTRERIAASGRALDRQVEQAASASPAATAPPPER